MDEKIEEYKELRQEIRTLLSRQHNIKNFAYVITLGVFGAITTVKELYLISLLSAFLIGLLWLSELRRIMAVFRLSTYIEIFIEEDVANLRYETLSRQNNFSKGLLSKLLRLINNSDILILFVFHSTYGVVRCYNNNINLAIILTILFGLIFIILGYYSYRVAMKGENSEKENWLKVKDNLLA
ncbi:hypothetical protein QQ008_07470 [Fulvivirgaceae bacterium BMA10]|uniref:Uncharacterized protein n=1 Tax=Splendidivirga corallicola TaxID=3051826 RepID=A0ABT8KLT4_9BACT|nr:hypothetical protein [Fulvivirgaceae bacterium BMA10]